MVSDRCRKEELTYELSNKVVVAGFARAKEFQEYREAAIAEKFNLDEVSQRILNADGASWIKQVKDKSTCFQLDPFHRNKAVKEKIHNRKAVRDIMELLETERIEELFEYLEIYKNSLGDDGKPCVERDRQKDETQPYQLEPKRR